jgi:5'-nucleotidase
MGGQITDSENKEDTDVFAVKSGKVSITPIHFDLTDYQLMKTLEDWHMKI